jgi:hypothetical protein
VHPATGGVMETDHQTALSERPTWH